MNGSSEPLAYYESRGTEAVSGFSFSPPPNHLVTSLFSLRASFLFYSVIAVLSIFELGI